MPRNLRRWNRHILSPISHQATNGISSLREKEKYVTFVSRKSNFLILLEIRNRPFATRILSFTAMASSTTCGHLLVFARIRRIFQELSFGSHMRSSWDLPFASSIKTGHHKRGHFDAQLVPEKTWKIQCCTFFSDNSVVFFNVIVYFYPSRFLHRSTLTSQTLNMSIIKKANCEYIVHQLWTRWLAGA